MANTLIFAAARGFRSEDIIPLRKRSNSSLILMARKLHSEKQESRISSSRQTTDVSSSVAVIEKNLLFRSSHRGKGTFPSSWYIPALYSNTIKSNLGIN